MAIVDQAELLEFPCDYLFKAFCAKDAVASFRISVQHAVSGIVACTDDAVKERQSSKGNYSCVTAMVRLHNRLQLEAINSEIRKIDALLFMI